MKPAKQYAEEVFEGWEAGLWYSIEDHFKKDLIWRITVAIEHDRRNRATIPGAPLSAERLEEIRERAEKATPGPWHQGRFWKDVQAPDPRESYAPWEIATMVGSVGPSSTLNPDQEGRANALFVIHAREDVPALLAYVDYLEALLSDALGHGEMDQWRAGRNAGLEEAAAWLDEARQEGTPEAFRELAIRITHAIREPCS
jgi:hypothetical protein